METGAERHARVERDGDGMGRARIRPGRAHEESADADRRDCRLPSLEPVLVLDFANGELADGSQTEGLEVPERIACVGDLRGGIYVLDEVRLHRVISAATRRDGNVDGDAVVTVATQDLAHRFDRLRVGGNGDLEPARSRRARCRPSRL